MPHEEKLRKDNQQTYQLREFVFDVIHASDHALRRLIRKINDLLQGLAVVVDWFASLLVGLFVSYRVLSLKDLIRLMDFCNVFKK